MVAGDLSEGRHFQVTMLPSGTFLMLGGVRSDAGGALPQWAKRAKEGIDQGDVTIGDF